MMILLFGAINALFFMCGLQYGKWVTMSDVFYKADNGIDIYRKGKSYTVTERKSV